MIGLRKRQRLLAALLGLGLCCASPAAMAAENVVFVSGAFRRSIAVADLEHRGLLHYDRRADRYDLHPVVRGVAAGKRVERLAEQRFHAVAAQQREQSTIAATWLRPARHKSREFGSLLEIPLESRAEDREFLE